MAGYDPNVIKTVLRVGKRHGATRKQLLAALETGIVESHFHNLPGGDADSQGWRQERASIYPNPRNVKASARRFFQEAKQHDAPGKGAGNLAADVQRPAAQYRGRYAQVHNEALRLMRHHGGRDLTGQSGSRRVGGGPVTVPGTPGTPGVRGTLAGGRFNTIVPTLDQEGFEKARRLALLGSFIASHNPNSPLLRLGVLSTQEPSAQDFMGQRVMSATVPGQRVRIPGVRGTRGQRVTVAGRRVRAGGRIGGRGAPRGRVAMAPGADRPGVSTKPIVKRFISEVAGMSGHPITITTGTNHSKMTVSGNVSDHWTGHGADIPATGAKLVRLGQRALIAAGMSPAKARKQRGGGYTLNRNGRRIQIIFNTNAPGFGDHTTHLHVGIS